MCCTPRRWPPLPSKTQLPWEALHQKEVWTCIAPFRHKEWEAERLEKEATALHMEAAALQLENQASRLQEGVAHRAAHQAVGMQDLRTPVGMSTQLHHCRQGCNIPL